MLRILLKNQKLFQCHKYENDVIYLLMKDYSAKTTTSQKWPPLA